MQPSVSCEIVCLLSSAVVLVSVFSVPTRNHVCLCSIMLCDYIYIFLFVSSKLIK